jgi:hypothetical protein
MPVAAAIPIALGIAKTATSLVNKGKAKRESKELQRTRPQYSVDKGYGQNLSLAESNLQGLSDSAENAYNQLADKQFSSSLDAILKSGGTATNVADVYGQGEEGRLRLAQLSDQMRVSQVNNLMKSREAVADQNEKAWQINQFAPWQDRAQANAQARQGAEEGIWSGLQTIGSGAMQAIDQQAQQKQQNQYFNNGTNNAATTTNSTFNPTPRPNVTLPTSSPNTQSFGRYQSNWGINNESDYLSQILNKPV